MLQSFTKRMRHHFGTLWDSQQAQTEEDLRVNLLLWAKGFRERQMTMRDVEEVLAHATAETCPFPTPNHFFGLWDKINATSLGHASFRPAEQVLMEHYGTPKAALLGHQSESAKAREKRVGNEHIHHLKSLF